MKYLKNHKSSLRILFFFISVLLFLNVNAQEKKEYILKGISVDTENSRLLLSRALNDLRDDKEIIQFQNQEFQEKFSLYENEAYLLIWEEDYQNGAFRPVIFFTDHDTIEFKLHNREKFNLNEVKGGSFNSEYQLFNEKLEEIRHEKLHYINLFRDSLFKENEYFSQEYLDLTSRLQNASAEERVIIFAQRDSLKKSGRDLSQKGKENNENYLSAVYEIYDWKFNEEMKNNISLIHLYGMIDDVRFNSNDPKIMNFISENYSEYSAHFEGHPYTLVLERELRGKLGMVEGNKLPELHAPDLLGELQHINALVAENKITLLNLWGTWCGPCITKTQLVYPLFKQFNNKGFGIVGVAREYKSTGNLKKRLETDFHEWPNLVDLDNQQKIWSSLGISNSAGMMIMLNEKGQILSIDPSLEEIERILVEKLD